MIKVLKKERNKIIWNIITKNEMMFQGINNLHIKESEGKKNERRNEGMNETN